MYICAYYLEETWIREYHGGIKFSGTQNFVYLQTSCQGTEQLLTDCQLSSAAPMNCDYNQLPSNRMDYYYAAVACQPCK